MIACTDLFSRMPLFAVMRQEAFGIQRRHAAQLGRGRRLRATYSLSAENATSL